MTEKVGATMHSRLPHDPVDAQPRTPPQADRGRDPRDGLTVRSENYAGAVTYQATVHKLLISAPSDVPSDDRAVVREAVERWNVIYGRQFGAIVAPMHWATHAAAEHGERPQASVNSQLVDDADIVVALFWHRLGSSTGESESGTIEELERAHAKGAHVAILRCGRDIPQSMDLDQLGRLRKFYEETASRSLMLEYADDADLARHVDTILGRSITQDKARAEQAIEPSAGRADVWPRIESDESVKTDSKGRLKTRRRWRLVLSNPGSEPARDVQYRLEPEAEGDQVAVDLDESGPLEVLPPGGEAPYPIVLYAGVARQARCIVTWRDSSGEHENQATVRFA